MTETGWLDGGWRGQHEECRRVGRPEGLDLVLIGDSLVQGWGGPGRGVAAAGAAHWEEFFGRRRAGNLGIAGDRVRHLLWRLEHGALDGLRPRRILLHAGTNDLADGTAPEEAAGLVLALARALRERAPGARLLLHGILPRGAAPDDPLRQAARATNELLRARIGELGAGASYLDADETFVAADGALRAELYEQDALHLGAAGYAAWGAALRAALGSPPPPFADGTERALEPAWIRVERIGGLIFLGMLSTAALVAIVVVTASGTLRGPWPALALAAWALLSTTALGLTWEWPRWEYRHAGWRVLPDRIEVWGGLLWRHRTSVPVSRVQYTDVKQGPLQRRHGIATLVIHTAGTEGASVPAPGLPHALALEIRDWLVGQTADDAV